MRGCQICRVRAICLSVSLSFAASRRFIEDLTGGFSPLRAPGLRSRNPTDDAGPNVICIFGVPVSGIAGRSVWPLQRGTSFSGIVNLWLLPARITSWRLPPLATSQAIE